MKKNTERRLIPTSGSWFAVYASDEGEAIWERVLAWEYDPSQKSENFMQGLVRDGGALMPEDGTTSNFVGYFPDDEIDAGEAAAQAYAVR